MFTKGDAVHTIKIRQMNLGVKFDVRMLLLVCGVFWALLVGAGNFLMIKFTNSPGSVYSFPAEWPADSQVPRMSGRATLVMLAHPRCPCTRASIAQLSSLMTHVQRKAMAYVLFLKPAGFTEDWTKTDLWQMAEAIPGVKAVMDEDGIESRRFNASISGQTALYDPEGHLLFSGGITGSRGYFGDNMGQEAIVSFLTHGEAKSKGTFAFGCPLFDRDSSINLNSLRSPNEN